MHSRPPEALGLGAFLLVLFYAAFWLAGCTTTAVMLHGQRVDNPALIVLAKTVHTIEVSTVALGGFLFVGHQVACGYLDAEAQLRNDLCVKATQVLKVYTVQYAPKIAQATLLAKKELELAVSLPTATNLERVQTALTMLQAVFDAAAQWGAGQGWKG